jgi:hypothetical protein
MYVSGVTRCHCKVVCSRANIVIALVAALMAAVQCLAQVGSPETGFFIDEAEAIEVQSLRLQEIYES